MILKEAAQQALYALVASGLSAHKTKQAREAAITALRAALAEDVPETNFGTMVQVAISKMETVEPVAWNEYPIDTGTTRGPMLMTVGDTLARAGFIKKQEPLTDEDIDVLRQGEQRLNFVTLREFRVIARAIERAHGIGGGE